jgi:hypothetical protein
LVYDQVTHMMVRAAATGAVDFSKAELTNPRWTDRLRLILDELTRNNRIEFLRALHQHYTSFMLVPRLTDESYGKIKEGANSTMDLLVEMTYPWDKERAAKTRRDDVKAAVGAWEDHYGKLDDPEVQAAIDSTVDAVRKHRAEYEIRRQAQADIWKGRRKGTRRERHRARRKRTRHIRRA